MNNLVAARATAMIMILLAGFAACSIGGSSKPTSEEIGTEDRAAALPPSEPSPTPAPTPEGFNINSFRIVDPALGKFPYFSLIDGYQQRQDSSQNKITDFDQYEFFDGTKLIKVEGRLQTIDAHGTGSSAFQVLKTYETLVKNLGGGKVFEGKLKAMRDLNLEFEEPRHRNSVFYRDDIGVYVIRMPDKEIWVEAFIPELPIEARKYDYYLTVVERKSLDLKAGLLSADEMKKAIDAEGHVALYINFDFDSATIKPDSQPIIDEIVKLLQENPGLNLTVEGHTDNVGKPDYNKQLSDKRAKAVASSLTAKGIDPKRLKTAGYGQEKPVADNGSEEGKSKNRRVELVKVS